MAWVGDGGSTWATLASTLAMASGQDSTCLPFCQLELGQRMPVICLMMASILTPERRAREMRRPVDSIWELAQPPV